MNNLLYCHCFASIPSSLLSSCNDYQIRLKHSPKNLKRSTHPRHLLHPQRTHRKLHRRKVNTNNSHHRRRRPLFHQRILLIHRYNVVSRQRSRNPSQRQNLHRSTTRNIQNQYLRRHRCRTNLWISRRSNCESLCHRECNPYNQS